MPPLPRRAHTVLPTPTSSAAVALVTVAMLALTGCGEDPDARADRRSVSSAAPSGSASAPEPTGSGMSSEAPDDADSPAPGQSGGGDGAGSGDEGVSEDGSPAAMPPSRRATGNAELSGHLLDGDRMPTPDGADSAWTSVGEPVRDDRPVGACQRFPLETVGAVSAVRREYAAQGEGVRGTQVVARFADRKSAWRAHEVLTSWREDCAEHLSPRRVDLGELGEVPVESGTAVSYAADHAPRGSDRVTATRLGILRVDDQLAVVELVAAAPGEWPRTTDPVRVALRRIARTYA